jgi:hypothetical protein
MVLPSTSMVLIFYKEEFRFALFLVLKLFATYEVDTDGGHKVVSEHIILLGKIKTAVPSEYLLIALSFSTRSANLQRI